jgi:hypothetical protein
MRLRVTRRQVLIGGAATLATCGGLGTWRACWYPGAAAYRGLSHFSARAGFILAAAVDAMLPDAADRAPATLRAHVEALDRYADGMAAADLEQLGQLVYALEHATLPFGGHVRRFSALSRADRRDVLADWQTAGMAMRRLGFRSLKALVFLVYYRGGESFAAVGYGGPVLPDGGGTPEVRARYDALLAPAGARP